ncbi:AAA domain-containing protein [Chromohalobacter sp. 48-RD10]|uniref:AAA domain-containing protein n=1 Tax=Chromohalobacter sp. 48-RD10 TaxID=2994063 RepID=UPI0024695478|nr:AAA domain-containing protein [Chromohalobacter sp. 48-RD10]
MHTFQGKEEDNVILVLGLSADAPGAAEWASSKSNLLNVAVTRAKKRVYIVGSTGIWGDKKYFSEAKEALAVSESA